MQKILDSRKQIIFFIYFFFKFNTFLFFRVDMYVEDKISHRGPFPINVKLNQTVAELKIQIEREFEIPRNVQRWILGKELAVDDCVTLKDHHVTVDGCPIFLYLVAPTNGKL